MGRVTYINHENSSLRSEGRESTKALSLVAADPFLSPDERLNRILIGFEAPKEDKEKGYVYSVSRLLSEPELSTKVFLQGCKAISRTSYRGTSALLRVGMDESLPVAKRVTAVREAAKGQQLSTALSSSFEEIKGFLANPDSTRELVIEYLALSTKFESASFMPILRSIPEDRLDDHTLWMRLIRSFASSKFPPTNEKTALSEKRSSGLSSLCIKSLKAGDNIPLALPFSLIEPHLTDREVTTLINLFVNKHLNGSEYIMLELLKKGERRPKVLGTLAIALARFGSISAIPHIRKAIEREDLDEPSRFKLNAALWALGERDVQPYLAAVFGSQRRIKEAKVTSFIVNSVILRNIDAASLRFALKFYKYAVESGMADSSICDNLDFAIMCAMGAHESKPKDESSKRSSKALPIQFLDFFASIIGNKSAADVVRTEAMQRFKYFGYPGVNETIVSEALDSENSINFRVSCIRELKHHASDEAARECLDRLVKSNDPTLRRAAISSLDRNLPDEAVGLLAAEVSEEGIKPFSEALVAMSLPETSRILYDSIFNPEEFIEAAKCLEKKLCSEKLLAEFVESLPQEKVGYRERYRRALLKCPELGILRPFRYAPEFLVELVNNRINPPVRDPRRSLLFLTARSDYNGGLVEFSSLIHQVSVRFRHRVSVYELAGSWHYRTALEEASSVYPNGFDTVVIAAHGSPESLQLGDGNVSQEERSRLGDASLNTNNIYGLKEKGKGAIKNGGYVYLHSCSTGRSIEGSNILNLHRMVFPNAKELGVIGSKIPLSSDDIHISFSPDFELQSVDGKSLTHA